MPLPRQHSHRPAVMALFVALVLYPGASFAHTALMRAGGLVVELFPFDGPGCSCKDRDLGHRRKKSGTRISYLLLGTPLGNTVLASANVLSPPLPVNTGVHRCSPPQKITPQKTKKTGRHCSLADFQGLAESCGLQTAQVYPNDRITVPGVRAASADGSPVRTPARSSSGKSSGSSGRVDIRKKVRSRLVRRLAEISRLQALPRDQLTDAETRQIAPNKRGEITHRLRAIWANDEREKHHLQPCALNHLARRSTW